MVFGILEDKYLEHVPGTALLSELSIVHGHEVTLDKASDLKRGTGRHAHIVLNPQPSDDPRDPLNWSRWKKEACFWTLAFAASLDGALSPMTGPGYVLLSKQFNTSVDNVASSFGAILLGLSTFMLVQGSFAVKFGHRIVYLCSVSLMFIACVWCAASPNLTSIRASRVFQGFGMSALQSLVASTIEQIFFIHERGARSVIWSFSIMAGITLGPLIYGYVVQNLSWQMGFWLVSIPLGICTLLVFFFVPETTFKRHHLPTVTTGSHAKKTLERHSLEKELNSLDEVVSVHISPSAPSYLSQLKIWNGMFSDDPLWKVVGRPLPFTCSPVTVFLFLSHGMQTAWLSLLPICSSTIFTIEYNFNASQTGLTNLGGIVGIVIAMVITGPLTDWGAVWMSKRNGGIYEPEYRLVFMSTMLLGVFGYAGWAVGTTNNMPWIGAVACLAMANFSMVVSGSAAVTYLLDTHGSNALHCFAISNFLKNLVLYGFSFFANGMIEHRGVKASLLILAGCQAFCCLASVPMYIFGKRTRSWIARHPDFFEADSAHKG
ncbi:major facilitator superfamily [Heterobasidion irregulare TC 32-1]|uniref:Major facilitator superfamily n=1 Tax=Heterobasidion irregulare (strain TC 32-1) TaxID=747525 RepID=W4KN83_HETIT|nr:major facilitator superfamily [Heterobasidion irregulare TC 32-1]ETW86516.1 major facilitator superfamily [Heterobasidion irregulare TC 32-1]